MEFEVCEKGGGDGYLAFFSARREKILCFYNIVSGLGGCMLWILSWRMFISAHNARGVPRS